MFYTMYLSSVCQRRQWPEPLYEPFRTRDGHHCKVRVNNREYSTEVPYSSESLARDGAAQKAYMICRNFSVNDGMFPGQRPCAGAVQGLPVAIGSGRRRGGNPRPNSGASYESTDGSGTSSGGNSPRSLESGFEMQMQQITQQVPKPASMGNGRRGNKEDAYVCYCRRAPVRAYGRCGWCLRESGWA